MAARTGLGAEHSGAEHGGSAGTRAKLRITRRQKQIDFEPIDLPNCLSGLNPKVIVRGYNPEKPPLKTHVPFAPTLIQTGQRVSLVNITPDVLNSTDPSIWSLISYKNAMLIFQVIHS